MAQTRRPTEIIELPDAEQEFGRVVAQVSGSGTRFLVENNGVTVAAVISATELDRLDRLDAEREDDFAIFDEIGAAFRGVDPEEIEREAAKAVAEVRAEMRAEREAGLQR
jgi:hypothetical protein